MELEHIPAQDLGSLNRGPVREMQHVLPNQRARCIVTPVSAVHEMDSASLQRHQNAEHLGGGLCPKSV